MVSFVSSFANLVQLKSRLGWFVNPWAVVSVLPRRYGYAIWLLYFVVLIIKCMLDNPEWIVYSSCLRFMSIRSNLARRASVLTGCCSSKCTSVQQSFMTLTMLSTKLLTAVQKFAQFIVLLVILGTCVWMLLNTGSWMLKQYINSLLLQRAPLIV